MLSKLQACCLVTFKPFLKASKVDSAVDIYTSKKADATFVGRRIGETAGRYLRVIASRSGCVNLGDDVAVSRVRSMVAVLKLFRHLSRQVKWTRQ